MLASLLAKLYVSSGSSEDRLREVYTDVSDAVEEGLLTDATSRNALYKIHVSLGKIVNSLDEQQRTNNLRTSRSVSQTVERQMSEEKTVVEVTQVKEEEEQSEDDVTVVPKMERDSVVEESDLTIGGDTQMQDM